MKRYRLAVCKGVDCRDNGSEAVFRKAQADVRAAGLEARCEVARGGCYGLCHLGPNVVIREDNGEPPDPLSGDDFRLNYEPGESFYWRMTGEKLARLLTEHIGADRPVDELLGDPSVEDDFRKRG